MGEFFALLTALFWAVAVILFRLSGIALPPLTLNLFKNTLGLALLAVTMMIVGVPFLPHAPPLHYLVLIGSGIVGISVSDTLFFAALNRLGASRTAIVDCLYAPFVIVTSYLYLGEKLTALQGIGGFLIVSSVFLLSFDRAGERLARGQLLKGILLGASAMATIAVAITAMKPILSFYSILWVSALRLAAGTAALLVVVLASRQTKETLRVFFPQAAWKFAIPGSVMGGYLSLLCWVAGLRYTQTNVAAILNQTSTLFVLVMATMFLKEKLTIEKWVAVGLALAGTGMVFSR